MSKAKSKFRRPLSVLLSTVCAAAVAFPLLAIAGADPVPVSPAAASARPKSALVNLIVRLGASGALKPEEANELVKLAEADAADARVQAALAALAAAQAEAAQARAESALAQATAAKNAPAVVPSSNSLASPVVVEPVAPVVPVAASVTPAPAPVAVPAEIAKKAVAVVEEVPAVGPAPSAPVSSAAKGPVVEDDTVRVTYVPEVVKAQLREEIKNDVLEQAKKERWATPRAVPDWVSRFTFYGDFRFRYESIYNHQQSNDDGVFPNFNAINTGSPFDTTGSVNSPQYNVNQDRNRLRVRARLGAAIDLGEGFTSNVRFATGENSSPISANQSLGAAGSGQGGNFSKYAVWLDRAYLKYQSEADPVRALTVTIGRFDNPFLGTSIIWADDLGFDGAVITIPAQIHLGGEVSDAIKPYVVVGAFPIFNTDLNYSSNRNDKFKSNDKWLEAAQLGLNLKIGKDVNVKLGAAYYYFTKTVGKLSSAYTPLTSSDAGDTDARRPSFAQKGNTYMALRDIIADSTNTYGYSNQWQYYGLASAFRNVAFDVRADYNHFEPFQISLIGEYVQNQAFSARDVVARGAVNNLGSTSDTSVGGGSAWIVGLKAGASILQKRWDWNVSVNYRNVESDAVIDGFCDSDFGGGGTNLKGLTLAVNLALAKRVSLGAKWMSATQVSGPTFKNDILQFDINGKF